MLASELLLACYRGRELESVLVLAVNAMLCLGRKEAECCYASVQAHLGTPGRMDPHSSGFPR